MKKVILDSRYSFYPLYTSLWGRQSWEVQRDASVISRVLEESGVKVSSALEMFCGESSLKNLLNYERYDTLDLNFTDLVTDTLSCDAYDIVKYDGAAYDAVLLPYFSINSTAPNGKLYPDLNDLISLFKNCHLNLRGGGAAVINLYTAVPYSDIYSLCSEPLNIEVKPSPSLLKYLKLKNTGKEVLKLSSVLSYHRFDSVVESKDQVTIVRGKDKLASISFRKNVYDKYWTEPEVFFALKMAGFKRVKAYSTKNWTGCIEVDLLKPLDSTLVPDNMFATLDPITEIVAIK